MNILFYITNHGYGHASRNVPIMEELIKRGNKIYVKSDDIRIDFLKRNLSDYNNIQYYDDICEVGLILEAGRMKPDVETMRLAIEDDKKKWPEIIERESLFIKNNRIQLVVSDTVAVGIRAAKRAGVKSIIVGNFDWALIYSAYYKKEIWNHYLESYKMAEMAIWYELHNKKIDCHNENCVEASLLSRSIDYSEAERIKESYDRPIVFVSLGGSAALEKKIDVSNLEYEFIVTQGLNLCGDNVHVLPSDMINTMDYIAASKYVISKGGWSTVAEILLQHKLAVLIMRSNNPEDERTKELLTKRKHCIAIDGEDELDFGRLLSDLSKLEPTSYDVYRDDCIKVCDIITNCK